jgi:DNA (cytosine-5)-methyltransferase 1
MHYYNEFDPKAAAWLRQLITDGLIPKGTVDERSITEVQPADLVGYTQCHFFAGIGGWPYALRLAGWPEDRPVWTGSCPCQPFSSAGKQKGKEDERHLWPTFFALLRGYNAISQREPVTTFGEQVSSAIRHGWLDGICADLEGEGYSCGHAVLGAHSVNAPHIRQRLYWVAYASNSGRAQHEHESWQWKKKGPPDTAEHHGISGLVNAISHGTQRSEFEHGTGGMPELAGSGLGITQQPGLEGLCGDGDDSDKSRRLGADQAGSVAEAGTVGGMAHTRFKLINMIFSEPYIILFCLNLLSFN